MATEQEDAVIEAVATPSGGVGATLKAARQAMGKELADVAQKLRIRQVFLSALEEGRHKDLPGGTYAIGFLRSYAEFLDLDGEELVRQFKLEAAGDLNSRAELIFPSPVSEGRIPGGAVIFLGLLVAALGYGGWYWLSSRGATIAEMVPSVPERMDTATPASGDTPAAEAAKTETAAEDGKPADTTAGDTAGADNTPPPTEEAAPQTADSGAAAPAQKAEAEAKPAEAVKAEAPEAKAPEPKAVAEKPAEPTKEEATAEAVEAEPAAAPFGGTVIGENNTDARIILKAATGDCWVQVREMDGQLLLSRLLRHGDSYRVPNRPGLTLMVGNAGALEITVDGKTAPSLGASGQVRRDIKLDPDTLI